VEATELLALAASYLEPSDELHLPWLGGCVAMKKTATAPVNEQFALEHGPVEIVDLPMKNGDFL
jgi:hypothetical protein